MDLSSLIQVAPVVFVQKKPPSIKIKSKSFILRPATSATFKSSTHAFARSRTRARRRSCDDGTKSANCAQTEHETDESESSITSSTLSVSKCTRSDDTLFDFKQKTARRIKLQKRKVRNDERQEQQAMADAQRQRLHDQKSAKMAMESAQRRVT